MEISPVAAAHGDAGGHPISLGHHVLDGDAEVWEALAYFREGLLEGLDELRRRVAWEELVVGRIWVHDLRRPPEVPVEMIS